MQIQIFGKKNCNICEKAKEKLRLLGLDFKYSEIEKHTTYHDGWTEDGSVEVMAAYSMYQTLPIICIDGNYVDYPTAMRIIKSGGHQGC